jgi:starch synthase
VKVLFATSEAYPLIKTGGLADVSGALPIALAALGADVRVLLPGYRAVLDKLPDARAVARFTNPFANGEVEIREGCLPGCTVPVYIVVYDTFFNRDGGPYQMPNGQDWPDNALRFGLLSYVAALLASDKTPLDWRPDVLHCNDWQTGLAPAYLRFMPKGTDTGTGTGHAPTLMTIHNLAYQGNFGADLVGQLGLPPRSFAMQGLEFHGHLSFLKAGLFYADRLTTVSPTYAREIQEPHLGFGMHGLLHERRNVLSGILNGIDTREWDPAHDTHLAKCYTTRSLKRKQDNKRALQQRLGLEPDAGKPLIAVISRITYQKGSDVVLAVAPEILREGAQIAILGSGERELEQALTMLAERHPGQLSVTIGYDEGQAHLMEAGADLFLMPSRYEPCGLNQMYSQRYGTPPVVSATGGLADTVVDASKDNLAAHTATGLVFSEMNYHSVLATVCRALGLYHDKPTWEAIQRRGMATDFSWKRSAQEYLALYRALSAA